MICFLCDLTRSFSCLFVWMLYVYLCECFMCICVFTGTIMMSGCGILTNGKGTRREYGQYNLDALAVSILTTIVPDVLKS